MEWEAFDEPMKVKLSSEVSLYPFRVRLALSCTLIKLSSVTELVIAAPDTLIALPDTVPPDVEPPETELILLIVT
jgi:hypothetical protein